MVRRCNQTLFNKIFLNAAFNFHPIKQYFTLNFRDKVYSPDYMAFSNVSATLKNNGTGIREMKVRFLTKHFSRILLCLMVVFGSAVGARHFGATFQASIVFGLAILATIALISSVASIWLSKYPE